MKTNKRLITIPDFMIALKAINDNAELSVTDLHHETRITYAHLHVLKQLFVQKGWINIYEEGVKHLLSVTEKGRAIVEGINLLLDRLEIDKNNLIEFRARTKHGWKEKEVKEISNADEDKLHKDAIEKIEEKKIVKAYPGVKLTEPVVEEPSIELTKEQEKKIMTPPNEALQKAIDEGTDVTNVDVTDVGVEPVVEEEIETIPDPAEQFEEPDEPVVEKPLTPPEKIEAEQITEEDVMEAKRLREEFDKETPVVEINSEESPTKQMLEELDEEEEPDEEEPDDEDDVVEEVIEDYDDEEENAFVVEEDVDKDGQ